MLKKHHLTDHVFSSKNAIFYNENTMLNGLLTCIDSHLSLTLYFDMWRWIGGHPIEGPSKMFDTVVMRNFSAYKLKQPNRTCNF